MFIVDDQGFWEQVIQYNMLTLKEDVAGGWRKLDSEEYHSVHPSARITTVIEPRGVGWMEHTTRMGDGDCLHYFSRHPWIEEATWET